MGPTILPFRSAPPDDPSDVRRAAAWWGTRAVLSLANFFHAVEDGDATAAQLYQSRAIRFATYAGTCARLAEGQ